MSEVFATNTVRFISGSPVRGSRSSGNSMSTSVISLPRSPQPTYTMMSASAHLASWCWTTVLPEPNGPGMHAVPPLATGKKVSSTRCPVMRGSEGVSFSAYGLPLRTGHFCIMVTSRTVPSSPFMRATTSATRAGPLWIHSTFPDTPGGTMILCSTTSVSWTLPMMSPEATAAPTWTTGTKSHLRSRLRPGSSTPLGSLSPWPALIPSSGRWIPS